MPTWQRRYVVACAAVVGFCLAYAACDYAEWSRLAYLPHERSWTWIAGPPGAAASTYLGTALWGVCGAVVAGGAVWLAARVVRRGLSSRWLDLAGAWAGAAFLFAGAYYTWNLWPF